MTSSVNADEIQRSKSIKITLRFICCLVLHWNTCTVKYQPWYTIVQLYIPYLLTTLLSSAFCLHFDSQDTVLSVICMQTNFTCFESIAHYHYLHYLFDHQFVVHFLSLLLISQITQYISAYTYISFSSISDWYSYELLLSNRVSC
jgi:hypothetical protein